MWQGITLIGGPEEPRGLRDAFRERRRDEHHELRAGPHNQHAERLPAGRLERVLSETTTAFQQPPSMVVLNE